MFTGPSHLRTADWQFMALEELSDPEGLEFTRIDFY